MGMGNIIEEINAAQVNKPADFTIGDTVTVHFKINEGGKEVKQRFKGIIIADKGRDINRSVTVRHLTGGIGVERVFPINSPNIENVEVTRRGDVRRAKLYYIRTRTGKAASQVKEKSFGGEKAKKK